jgi:hypothetical protein
MAAKEIFITTFSTPLYVSRTDKGDPLIDLSRARICQRCFGLIFDDLTERHSAWHRTLGA